MEKKRVLITKDQITDFYQADEDGLVRLKDPNIIPVLDMSGYEEPYETESNKRNIIEWEHLTKENGFTNEEIEFYSEANHMLDEFDFPYSRLSSYEAMHETIWKEDIYRKDDIRKVFLTIRRRVKLLANPIADTSLFLRNEHNRILSLFDQIGYWADIALDSTRSQAADIMLTYIWEKETDSPFGNEEWTLEKLREKPMSYWGYDDVWTWNKFWEKAEPILEKYFKAVDYLITIRILQYYIRLCELNKDKGYKTLLTVQRTKINNSDNIRKRGRGKSIAKMKMDQIIRDDFENFVKVEGLPAEAAIKKIHERTGYSLTKIDRVLKSA